MFLLLIAAIKVFANIQDLVITVLIAQIRDHFRVIVPEMNILYVFLAGHIIVLVMVIAVLFALMVKLVNVYQGKLLLLLLLAREELVLGRPNLVQ
jgi:hypothetical protein